MRFKPSLLRIAALAATAALPVAVSSTSHAAGDLSYSWLQLDYLNVDVDDFDSGDGLLEDFDDGNGWGVNGSLAFTPMFYGFAGYSETDSDVTFTSDGTTFLSSSQDVARLDVGLGINVPLGLNILRKPDLVVRVAYVDIDTGNLDLGESSDPSIDDLRSDSSDGWYSDVSLRAQFLPWLETSAGLRYTDIGDSNELSLLASLLFEVSPSWGINLGVDLGGDIRTYAAGVRYSFARF